MKHVRLLNSTFLTSAMLVLLSVAGSQGRAQNPMYEKMQQISIPEKDDTFKVKALISRTGLMPFVAPDSAMLYADSIIKLSARLEYPFGIACGQHIKATVSYQRGDFPLALYIYKQVNDYFMGGYDTLNTIISLDDLGDVYGELGDIPKSLHYARMANYLLERMPENIQDRIQGYYPKEKFSYRVDQNTAKVYLGAGLTDSAIFFVTRAMSAFRKANQNGDWSALPVILGEIYLAKKEYLKAIEAFQIPTSFNFPNDIANNYIGRANAYWQLGLKDSTAHYGFLALEISENLSYPKGIMGAADLLSKTYEESNPTESLKYLKLSLAERDSIYGKDKINQLNTIQRNEELRKLDAEAAEKEANNRSKFQALAAGLTLLLVASILLWRNNRQKQQAKEKIEKAYEDLQEAQRELQAKNRELEIETALERVRTRTMAMQKSEELSDTVYILFQQFRGLGVDPEQMTIGIYHEEKKKIEIWLTKQGSKMESTVSLPLDEPYVVNKSYRAWKEKKKSLVIDLTGPELEAYNEYRNRLTGMDWKNEQTEKRRVIHFAFFSLGQISISRSQPMDEEAIRWLERFSAVLDLTYTRFLDLKKAEAQAREARIEAALEKVRSRSLAMHSTEELKNVISLVLEKLQELGIVMDKRSAIILVFEAGYRVFTQWVDSPHQPEPLAAKTPYMENAILADFWEAREKGIGFYEKPYLPEEKDALFHYFFDQLGMEAPGESKKIIFETNSYSFAAANEKNSSIAIASFTGRLLTAEESDLLKRFARVFEQSYIRFLDLQKAEIQAREARIEAALERVRARAMAMQSSTELGSIVETLYTEFNKLNFSLDRILIMIFDPIANGTTWWMASPEEGAHHRGYFVRKYDVEPDKSQWLAWEQREARWQFLLEGEVKRNWDQILFYETEMAGLPAPVKEYMQSVRSVYLSTSFANFGGLMAATLNPLDDDLFDILQRFTRVFDLAYTRFNDLKKAEARAREAQIELALERVRARTMAMHQSSELGEAASLLFKQLSKLGASLWVCGFAICKEESEVVEKWMADPDGKMMDPLFIPCTVERGELIAYESWKKKDDIKILVADANMIRETHEAFGKHPSTRVIYDITEEGRFHVPDWVKIHIVPFRQGYLHIVTTQSFEETQIFMRFAKVFEQTYTRFLDLQKAEAQAREAKIETALERVRSRTMAMHSSDELLVVIEVIAEQLNQLDIGFDNVSFGINSPDDSFDFWLAAKGQPQPLRIQVPYLNNPAPNRVKDAARRGLKFFADVLTREENIQWVQHILDHSEARQFSAKVRNFLLKSPGYARSTFILNNINIYIGNYNAIPYSEEQNNIVKRFAQVFEQSYTRFLDLKKAEAQAREARIETALERVRSKTMAMHKSEEVMDVAVTLYDELQKLDFKFGAATVVIMHRETGDIEHWVAGLTQRVYPQMCYIKYFKHPLIDAQLNAWKNGDRHLEYSLSGKEFDSFAKVIFEKTEYKNFPDSDKEWMIKAGRVTFTTAFMKHGALMWAPNPVSHEHLDIMQRFAKVFEQSYTRFLDLQKAEAQAREAKIEATLEKVRSRTMAMQKSDELTEVAGLLFKQVAELGVKAWTTGFNVWNEDNDSFVDYVTNPQGGFMEPYIVRTNISEVLTEIGEARKRGDDFFVQYAEGDRLKDSYHALSKFAGKGQFEKILQEGFQFPSHQYDHFVFGSKVSLMFITYEPVPEAHDIFKRLGKVFEQTYTRFLDLKKAEDQAREATIEAALEKVRGKAMAMHNSADLSATASMVFSELRKLGINPIRCGVGLLTKESRKAQLFSATSSSGGDSLALIGWVLLQGHPVLEKIYETWQAGEEFYPELSGEQLRSYYERLLSGLSVPSVPDWQSGEKQYGHFLPFSIGCLYAWSDTQYNEMEVKILRRFATIIDLTFRRYMELQKSEANTREAIRQASLDRVRAEIASMRTRDDLERITPLIWNELNTLGIPFVRCGVFIMDNAEQQIHTFLSTPDGEAIAAFHLPYDTPGKFANVVGYWKNKKNYVDHWGEAEFESLAGILVKQGAFETKEQYLKTLPKEGIHLHFLPFLQGMLYVGNTAQLSEDEMNLIQSVADAFSTAYARYEDFNRLEAAKQQIEKTLVDLKQAQQQLVQSEKMASLGELTAGIAHEIQNPLNFVNNFSDVSAELLEEMKTEMKKGHAEGALAIAEDVRDNLEKILHHGKRADAIVKGMLQHSRTSTGQKEPTDLNALAEEYLRLAFHGLRAKDKSFNASFRTHLDPSIGKINLIPQDIGRVLVNLINNAFYSVSEKKKRSLPDYEPTVTISTRNLADGIQLTVEDNGIGIPEKIKDKIFQPFFTTKPSGQGTGLGLSLSYDIIKAHGGEIKLKSAEGQGSAFVIQLPMGSMGSS